MEKSKYLVQEYCVGHYSYFIDYNSAQEYTFIGKYKIENIWGRSPIHGGVGFLFSEVTNRKNQVLAKSDTPIPKLTTEEEVENWILVQ